MKAENIFARVEREQNQPNTKPNLQFGKQTDNKLKYDGFKRHDRH